MSKRTKAERRRASRQTQTHANLAHVEATAPHLLKLKRGRPRTNDPVPPTPETLAKLQPDLLNALVHARILTQDEASSGREILDAWELLTSDVDSKGSAMGNRMPMGKTHTEGKRAVWLQATWRAWAPECLPRTGVRCFVVPEWVAGTRPCDRDGKGAAGVLAKAIRWWQWAGQDAGRSGARATRYSASSVHAAAIA